MSLEDEDEPVVPEFGVFQSVPFKVEDDADDEATGAEADVADEAAGTCEAPEAAAAAAAAAASGRRRGGGETIFWISLTRCAVSGLLDPSVCARLYDSLASRKYKSPRFSYASA